MSTSARCERAISIRLDNAAWGLNEDRDALVRIGTAQLDDNNDRVILDRSPAARLASLPRFTHDHITRKYENALLPAFGGTVAGAGAEY